jgi:hypothetical protein
MDGCENERDRRAEGKRNRPPLEREAAGKERTKYEVGTA